MFEAMTIASGTEGSGALFLAATGATAALDEMIFVGLSVCVRPLLETHRPDGGNFLTDRALKALVFQLDLLDCQTRRTHDGVDVPDQVAGDLGSRPFQVHRGTDMSVGTADPRWE